MKIAEETVDTIPEIVSNLADVNNEESGLNLKLEVSIESYIPEITRVFTLRDEDDVLVGYSVFIVTPHNHYKSKVFAMNDVVYVHPAYRASAKVFMDECVDRLDVDYVSYSMPYNTPHQGLMELLGFEPAEIVYYKVKE